MTKREFGERLRRRAKKADVQLGDELALSLEAYFRLLEAWNAKINLTALNLATDSDTAIDRLLVEPLVAVRQVPEGARTVIDIGSGGGSPAIPMKLARPDLVFTLVEAKTRKSAFLREAGRHLKVDLRVETSRFEALLSSAAMHEAFDLVTMRAVRVETKVLVGLQAFLRPGGKFLLFRGPEGRMENLIAPPLVWSAAYPLIESMQSQLVVLEKLGLGLGGRD
jgi:16S rRNA (guanine527-N7)-methyltransferase